VVNLGVSGANPGDYLEHLRDAGVAYDHATVIVTVMANDFHERCVRRGASPSRLELPVPPPV
jgi:hypothetical protein